MESIKKQEGEISPPISQHQTITFPEEGLTFDSNFDSGNMASVEKKSQSNFEIVPASDCQDLGIKTESFRVWFYFSISNDLNNLNLKLSIKNLSLFLKETFSKGHIPAYHVDGENEGALYDRKWSRLSKKENNFVFEEEATGIKLSFTFALKASEKVYFAFSFPWSYQDNLNYIKTLKILYKNHPKIYFKAETMVTSLEQRKINLLTITSNKNQSLMKEKTIQRHLFKKPNNRPYKFTNKKYIVISARVHPGESPSSYILQGCIDFALNNLTFLDNFVLVVIPMLNPDGVFRGYYRLDTNGKNLNRVYHSSYFVKYPAIFALKRLISYLNEENRLFAFFDLHAHNIIEKGFLFGNKAENLSDHLEIILIPKIMSLISPKFEIKNCKFESKATLIEPKSPEKGSELKEEEKIEISKNKEKTLEIKEKEDNDKEIGEKVKLKTEAFPIAKTHFFKHEGLKLSYTFECSYNGGFLTDTSNFEEFKNSENFFFFDRDGFKESGTHLMMSVFESNGLNSKSILEQYGFKTVHELKLYLQNKGGL